MVFTVKILRIGATTRYIGAFLIYLQTVRQANEDITPSHTRLGGE
jgi:hypothetical protein